MYFLRYEGTGRSLSLKLLQQLRTQSSPSGCNSKSDKMNQPAVTGRTLYEVRTHIFLLAIINYNAKEKIA